MTKQALRIGVLAYTTAQHRTLSGVVESGGHQIGCKLLVSQIDSRGQVNIDLGSTPVDAWVVDVDSGEGDDEYLDDWLDGQNVPIIFCDGEIPASHQPEYDAWSRRLLAKLTQLSGTINLSRVTEGSARRVWVLAASTGGPEAVKQFLSELPPKLGIGFIYVQHIDAGYDDTLVQMMTRHSHYPAKAIEHGDVVMPNELAIVPADRYTEVLSNGTFLVDDEKWSTGYAPSVDSIVSDVAYSFRERSGVIIFTGMGDDGAASSRLMKKNGGQVWVQTPSSCTSTSMPESVLDTGCVDFKGTPYTLAQHLTQEMQAVRYQETRSA
ncbi:chemotaxis protein CheB [Aurantivibrio plasticivorans]